MNAKPTIETERLILRPWRMTDLAEFVAAVNTPKVMEFLGGVQTSAQCENLLERQIAFEQAHGFCFWPLRRKEDDVLLGFCGLKHGEVGPIADKIEIGWRLRQDAWGQGYAGEAAKAALAWGWANLDCGEIFAITVPANRRSRALMERLDMTRRSELDFAHPVFAADHPLSAHVTYSIARPQHG